ncbi:PA-phosphatase-like phosphoesterase [Salinisphaera sp. PC39]|uniref:VTT domain-containing protein n=1 Tax=Salinisphaera sp. PC39 TaxID=1304156 RepID=UPI00334020E5
MDTAWLQAIPVWVEAHPVAALALVFAAALAESLFLAGLLVPGALLMFIAGMLIGTGSLPAIPTLAWAVAGAVAGDGASYALGRYGRRRPWFRRGPRLARTLARGEAFFAAHGGKSVILGRFVGPLRAVIPTVAGAAGMSWRHFLVADVIAAIGWAPVYILPGAVFGASLEIAARVAGRLAVLLLLALASLWGLVWLSHWLLRLGGAWGREHAQGLLAWSRRHRRLGLLGPALADPRQPEMPALAISAVLLLIAVCALQAFFWGLGADGYPLRADALVHHALTQLHTPWSDRAARVIAELGSPAVYLPLAVAVTAALALLGNYRTAAHWAAAVTFAGILVLGLWWLVPVPPPAVYYREMPLSAVGAGHLILAGTVYGFLAVVLAARRPPNHRQLYYSAATALVGAIGLARLYLGLAWLSDLLVGLSAAFLWLALLAQGYRRQRPQFVRTRPVLSILGAILAAAAAWQLAQPLDPVSPVARPLPRTMVEDWFTAGYRTLPASVEDLAGRRRDPLNVQAAGSLASLRETLTDAGWYAPPALTPARALRWLQPDAGIDALPLLPRMHDGLAPVITRVRAGGPDTRFVLRLWPTNQARAPDGAPLWVGQATRQVMARPLPLTHMPVDTDTYDAARTLLAATLTAVPRVVRRHPDARDRGDGRVLLLSLRDW